MKIVRSEQDYAYGAAILTLRTKIGLTGVLSLLSLSSSMIFGTQECGVSLAGLLRLGMCLSEAFFSQSQGAAVQSFGLLVFAHGLSEFCQSLKGMSCEGVLGSHLLLKDREGSLI